MNEQEFSEAIVWRELARDMRNLIGYEVTCGCVETEAYREYAEAARAIPKHERILWVIHNPFEGDEVSSTCPRCELLARYEDLVPSEVVVMEAALYIKEQE